MPFNDDEWPFDVSRLPVTAFGNNNAQKQKYMYNAMSAVKM